MWARDFVIHLKLSPLFFISTVVTFCLIPTTDKKFKWLRLRFTINCHDLLSHSQGFRGEDNFDQKLMTKDRQFNCYRNNISPSYMGDLMADLRKVAWYCMQKYFIFWKTYQLEYSILVDIDYTNLIWVKTGPGPCRL